MRRRPAAFGAALTACAAACDGARPPGDTCEPSPTVELGTGVDTFEPIADGEIVALVFGPQGGFHVPLAVRACGGVSQATTHATAERVDDGLRFVDVTLDHDWRYADPCCGALVDLKGYVFSDAPGFTVASLDGAEVLVRVDVSDLAGTSLSDARSIVLRYVAPQ